MLIVGLHALDRPGDHVEELLGLVGLAGEARLVELEEVDARRDQGLHLAVDDRDQGLGHRLGGRGRRRRPGCSRPA